MLHDSKQNLLILVAFFFFSLFFIKSISPHGLATSPDSLSYLEVAKNIQEGNGAVGLDRNFKSFRNNELIPITIWPPLYPYIIAFLLPDNPNEYNTQYISALLLGVSLVFIYLILKRLTTNLNAAILSLLYCITVPILLDYSFIWSETLFLTLYVTLLWTIINFLEYDAQNSRKKYIFLFFFSTCLVFLFYTRYAGILITLVLFYLLIKCKTPKKELLPFLIATIIILIPIFYLMYSNYIISNSISGSMRPPSDTSPLENIKHVFSASSTIFPAFISIWLTCAAITITLMIGFHYMLTKKSYNEISNSSALILQSSFLLFVFYIFIIIALRSFKEFDTIGVRLLSPAFPAFWIFCCTMLFHCFDVKWKKTASLSLVLLMMTSLIFQGATLYQDIRKSLTNFDTPEYPYRRNYTHSNSTILKARGNMKKVIDSSCSEAEFLFTRRAVQAEFVTGKPSVTMPESINNDFITELNKLSTKACFLFTSQSQFNEFTEVIKEQKGTFKYQNLGSTILVQYPF